MNALIDTKEENMFSWFMDDPVEASKANMKAKLAVVFVQTMKAKGLSQAETAEIMGVTQSRISNLVRGKLSRFSIDTLLQFMLTWGYNIEIHMMLEDTAEPFELKVK
jgi:predicted XRE-type DNA-binding protein